MRLFFVLVGLSVCSFSARGREIAVVNVGGTPFERGLAHGRALRGEIQRAVPIWKADLARTYKMDADVFIHRFLARTDYLASIRKWTPGLLEEVRGIAEGSGFSFETMLVYQLIDEYWVNGAVAASPEHCSAVAVRASGKHPGIVAQNMDLEGFRDGFETVLHVKNPSGVEALVLTAPGLIALDGINNRSVAVVVNTLAQLAHRTDGLPVAFVIRGILEKASYREAARFVQDVKHASGQNYLIADQAGMGDFEASSGKVAPIPIEGAFVYHTNHPLANDDLAARYQADEKDDSHVRYAALRNRLQTDSEDMVGRIEAALRSHDSESHPVSVRFKGNNHGCTFASVVMVLSKQPYLLIAPGAPDLYEYRKLDFPKLVP
jgi:isopenicillin-N N-acyltransferase like protein